MAKVNRGMPYETIWGGATPVSTHSGSGGLRLGTVVVITVAGFLYGMRVWDQTGSTGITHLGWVVVDGTNHIYHCSFQGYAKNPTTTRWHSAFFKPRIPVAANTRFLTSVEFNGGYTYGYMVNAHSGDTDTHIGHFTLPADTGSVPNSGSSTVFGYFWTGSLGAAKVATDLLFSQD